MRSFSTPLRVVSAAAALVALGAVDSDALTLSFGPAVVSQGSSTTFEVVLDNPLADGATFEINSFNIQLAFTPVIPSGTTFSLADRMTTNTYLLEGIGDVADGDFWTTSNAGSIINFGDVDFDFGSQTVNPGNTFGVGRVTVAAAPGATLGMFNVEFQLGPGLTEFTDENGDQISITAAVPGTVTVVPEPVLLPASLLFFGLTAMRRSRVKTGEGTSRV